MRRLNVKLLVWLISSVLVLVVGVHFLHAYQTERNANVLLSQAEKFQKDGKLRDAMKQYSQYLKHRKKDTKAYEEYANLAVKIAQSPDARPTDYWSTFKILDQAVTVHPELDDVRRKLVDFAMAGDLLAAQTHIQELQRKFPNESALDVKEARCLLAMGRDEEARKKLCKLLAYDDKSGSFTSAKAKGAGEVEAYAALAAVYKRGRNPERADGIMQRMLEANPKSYKAYLTHGLYVRQFAKDEEAKKRAEAELDQALSLVPKGQDPIEVTMSAAQVALANANKEKAQKLLDAALKQAPKRADVYVLRAQLLDSEKQPEKALQEIAAGLKELPKNPQLLLAQIEFQLKQQNDKGAKATIAEMRSINFNPELRDFYQAQIDLHEQKWTSASQLLERVRGLTTKRRDMQAIAPQIDVLLGEAYENTGQFDIAGIAYRRALETDPGNPRAKAGIVRALERAGEHEKARLAYQELMRGLPQEVTDRPELQNQQLQLMIADQVRRPINERDWTEVDKMAQQVRATLDDAGKIQLDAELLILKDEHKQAQALLLDAVKRFPKNDGLWIALVQLIARQAATTPEQIAARKQRTIKALDMADAKAGDTLALRTVRLRMLIEFGGDTAKQLMPNLEKGLDKLTTDQRMGFLIDLGNAYSRMRDYPAAQRVWTRAAELRPEDPTIRQTMFEMAIATGDRGTATAMLNDIKRIAGASSPIYRYCQALQLVEQAKADKSRSEPLLNQARTLLGDAAKVRVNWEKIPGLLGDIDLMENKLDAAIANYDSALNLAPGQPVVAQKLVALYFKRGEYDKAKSLVPRLTRLDAKQRETLLRDLVGRTDPAKAVELAAKAVQEDPNDVRNVMEYARLLERVKRNEEALKVYQDAVKKFPTSGEAWLGLANLYHVMKDDPAALETLRSAQAVLPDDKEGRILSRGYGILGRFDLAEKYFKQELSAHPDDLETMQGLATMYVQSKQASKAGPLLEQMLAAKPNGDGRRMELVAWARRGHAELTAAKGTYQDLLEALKELGLVGTHGSMSMEDMVVAANLLANRPEPESRDKAIELYKQIESKRQLNAREQITVAHLYERAGEWLKARDMMKSLTRDSNQAAVLADYTLLLIKHDELEDAAGALSKLEQVAGPNSPVTIEARARLLAKQGHKDRASKLLEKLIPPDATAADADRMFQVAALMENIGDEAAALNLVRAIYEVEKRASLALGAMLGRHGDIDEAFRLLDISRKSQPIGTIIPVAVRILRERSAELNDSHYRLVEGWIQSAMENDPATRLHLAELRDLQGRTDEAIRIYRELMVDPKIPALAKASVKNNLAYLIATSGRGNASEALELLKEAKGVIGPIGDLLDTEGMVYLALGNASTARNYLRVAVADEPTGSKYFHLALAELQANNRTAAREAFKKARDLKLEMRELPAAERKDYQRMANELGK